MSWMNNLISLFWRGAESTYTFEVRRCIVCLRWMSEFFSFWFALEHSRSKIESHPHGLISRCSDEKIWAPPRNTCPRRLGIHVCVEMWNHFMMSQLEHTCGTPPAASLIFKIETLLRRAQSFTIRSEITMLIFFSSSFYYCGCNNTWTTETAVAKDGQRRKRTSSGSKSQTTRVNGVDDGAGAGEVSKLAVDVCLRSIWFLPLS